MSKSPFCTLSDAELTEKAKELIQELIDSGGRSWVLNIPARPNSDPDLIFTELNERFKKSHEAIKVFTYDNNRLKGEVEGLRTAGDEASGYIEFLDVQNNRLRKMLSDICEKACAGTEIEKMIVEFFNEINTERESAAGREDDWIDVNDSLPEESGRYWCYVEHLGDLGFSYFQWNCDYNSQLQRFSDMTLKNGERITHWRPLAKPPKFKQQKEK